MAHSPAFRGALVGRPQTIPHRLDRLVSSHAAQVDLRPRHARVRERVPHDVETCPRADEVHREGVTEPAGVQAALDARLASEPRQQVPNVRLVELPPGESAEQGAAARDVPPPAQLEPAAEKRSRAGVYPHYAALPALAAWDDEGPSIGIEVLDRERLAGP